MKGAGTASAVDAGITYAIKQRAIKKREKKTSEKKTRRRFWRRDDDEYYCRSRSSACTDP
jgi:hypothetical protein